MPKLISEQDGAHSDYYVVWDNGYTAYIGCSNSGDRSVGGVRIDANAELQAVLAAEKHFIRLATALAAKHQPVSHDED